MSITLARSLLSDIPLDQLNASAIINEIQEGNLIPPEDTLALFMKAEGFWRYDPDAATNAHVLISSDTGNHSDGHIDCSKPLQYSPVRAIFVAQMIHMLMQRAGKQTMRPPTVVVSASHALAREFGRQMNIRSIFIEESAVDAGGKMNFDIFPGDRVLMTEGSFIATGAFLERIGVINRAAPGDFSYVPIFPVMVNLSGQPTVQNYPLISLLSLDDTPALRFSAWAAESCPHCQRGSVAVQPDSPEGWRQLTGQA